MSTVNSRSAMHLIPGQIGMSVLSMLESISPGLPYQSPRPFIQQPQGKKCDRTGHKFDILRSMKAPGDTDHYGASVKCRRCGCTYDYIPVRRAELNLHPQATQQSRKHWLKEKAA